MGQIGYGWVGQKMSPKIKYTLWMAPYSIFDLFQIHLILLCHLRQATLVLDLLTCLGQVFQHLDRHMSICIVFYIWRKIQEAWWILIQHLLYRILMQ